MKIAFYLQNRAIKDVDCSRPDLGNPGIGGTEYLFVAIPWYLNKLVRGGHEILYLKDANQKLPNIESILYADNISDIVSKQAVDIVVVRYSHENYLRFKDTGIKTIFWCHNFVKRQELSLLANDKNVVAIVCVGSEQLHMYRDHQAYKKSVVIYNGFPVNEFVSTDNNIEPFSKRKNIVTFLGNLVYYKGFHLLAKAWPDVVAKVPDAKLNVIGGANLYDRNKTLGDWGIAESDYEESFMRYLVDERGNLMDSVIFHGVLGIEKNDILLQTKVGVPNPSGVSETFCIAAIEMQLCGAVVTTIEYGGFLNTVAPSGILYKKTKELADSIVHLLNRDENDYDSQLDYFNKFSFDEISKSWILLFDALENSEPLQTMLKPQYKSVKDRYRIYETNRKIKDIVPFGKYLPTIALYKSICNKIKGI